MPHKRDRILLITVAVIIVVALLVPPIPQPASHHDFADTRTFFGIPNAFDVLSNIPFALIGLAGIIWLFSSGSRSRFIDQWERWPYFALFAGLCLTAFGSSYYHLAPDNARLMWDRLPLTIGFMGLSTAMIAERASTSLAKKIFVPLLVAGALSVLYWYWGDLRDAGDLRFYILVQFGSLLLIIMLISMYPPRYTETRYLVYGLLAYGAAKVFEGTDALVYAAGHIVSGHTLKHLIAAAGVGAVAVMLTRRNVSHQHSQTL